ncbi:hypothetical protein [Clostridium perfringens]|uniref:hypothetical protein n=1 Tax=Clostridium perfringens TaxID=1502 RepID=UPI002247CB39|nr:hypothetical protein [Clostridium perfringens]MCX0407890.1 hypothetical protein [Clostridium perfringens]
MYGKKGHLNCRTEKRREKIVENYNIELVTVANLLKGRTMESDAGGIIEDRYYEFRCTSKTNKFEKATIICGKTAGESLIRLAKIKYVVVFNPLRIENEIENQGDSEKIYNDSKIKWNKIAKELFYAINILGLYWKKPLNGILYEIKRK